MGMILFNKNGVFNPTDYGLSVGDLIQVVVVGGGAGGGCMGTQFQFDVQDQTVRAGNGGSSSFGSYITAIGGGAGGYNSPSYVGGYLGAKSRWCSGGTNYTAAAIGGGGAGGWHPSADTEGGNGGEPISFQTAHNMATVGTPNLEFSAPIGLAGAGAVYARQVGHCGASPRNSKYSGWGGISISFQGGSYINAAPLHSILCGAGSGAGDGIANSGAGGSGYGAGGGAGAGYVNASNYAQGSQYAGNSGEIVKGSIILPSADAIPVTVGGGGAGISSCIDTSVSKLCLYAGGNGTGGAAGLPPNSLPYGGYIGGRGGYGDQPAGDSTFYSAGSSNSGISGGGGGAGGCVAVYW